MRFVWAVLAFVLATVLIGAGIAQRTIFLGPSEKKVELTVDQPEPYILIDGEVLRANPGLQTLMMRGKGDIFAAYGRTADMKAWLSDASYNSVTLDKQGEPKTQVVAPKEKAEGEGRNPSGSDLWLDSFTDKDSLITPLKLPAGMRLLVARDGVQDAPSDLVVSWPIDSRTPLAGPLIVAGGVMLLIGLILYVLGIRHQRRGRGPRRKGPGPMPATEPIDRAVDTLPEREAIAPAPDAADAPASAPADAEEQPKGEQGRTERSARSLRRRLAVAVPALGLTAVLATGCTADSWPQLGEASPTPSPTATVVAPENQKPPAVTVEQANRILKSVAETVAKADEAKDADLAATRLDGEVLAARKVDYALRAKLADRSAPNPIPTDKVEVLLPEATDNWPRTVLMLTSKTGDDKTPPVIFTMTQADPWSNYRITSLAEMQASAELPKLAPEWMGTSRVPPESNFLMMQPKDLGAAFASLVDEADKSQFDGVFDEAAHKLATAVRDSRAAQVKKLAEKNAATTSKADFDMQATDADPISMTTLNSGAIVAVSVVDLETITPRTPDAVIRFGDVPEAKALTGVSESSKGVKTTYGLQLFFSVPAQGATEQIRLLGYHQDTLSIEVLK